MESFMNRLIVIISMCGLLLFTASAFGEVNVGPSNGVGLPPRAQYTEEYLQQMIEERGDTHFCALKSNARSERSKSFTLASITLPTSNMYDYDVLYYEVNLEISFSISYTDGYVEMQLASLVNGLSYVDLNLTPYLNVSAVRLNGIAQSYTHSTQILSVNLNETFDTGEKFMLKVEYGGYAVFDEEGGMFFDYNNGHTACNTTCEPFGSRNWWPCKDFPFDKPDSMDIVITHPTTYEGNVIDCGSAGTLMSVTDNGDGMTTTHWFEKYPIATYLVALMVTDFDQTVQQWEYAPGQFMPVVHNMFPYISPSDPYQSGYGMLQYTVPALEAYSNQFGLYPFVDEKYGNMHCNFPGMEHQTMSSIGTYWGGEYVIIHELAHQWAGDQVTCKTFHDIWLNEGFATYFETIYFEQWATPEFAKQWLMSYHGLHRGSPYVEDLDNDNIFDFWTVYAKGAWLAHMLRDQMGDSLFFPAMEYFYKESEFAGKSASTDDLNFVVSQFYGSDMSWFFSAWVYQEGQPEYEYSYQWHPDTISGSGYFVDLFIKQTASYGFFPMHIDIEVTAGAYDSTFRIWNGTIGDLYHFHLPDTVDNVTIDPNVNILKTSYHVPLGMHIYTATLPDAVINEPYSTTVNVIGGVPDYFWQRVLGQFPPGVTMNSATGEISGTPTWEGMYYIQLRCTDSDSPPNIDTRAFNLKVGGPPHLCGDADGSGEVDIDDVVYLIAYIFSGGPAPDPLEAGDADSSGAIDIDDVVYLIAYIFSGGPEPCAGS